MVDSISCSLNIHMQEPDKIRAFLKKVGRGKTLSRDLTREEAREAVASLLRGEFTPAQTGAFLQALRIKETSVDELVGAAEGAASFRQGAFPVQPAGAEHPLVVNLAFDTARKGGVVSLVALAWLRSRGLVRGMVVWEPPSIHREADAVGRTLDALRSQPWLAASMPETATVREMCPRWQELAPIRQELGFRSILNTVEKLLRPWETAPVVVGISHDTFSERLCHVLNALGAPRVAVVRGNHGTCDLGLGEKPTEVHAFADGMVREVLVGATDFPWKTDPSVLLVSSLDSWRGQLSDETSPLWGAVLAQAAFFHSIATGSPLPESVNLVASLPKGPSHA